MDSTVHPSTVPIAVTIASEQEPVECAGLYTERADGFSLEFFIRSDRFTIVHTDTCTRLCAHGTMSYELELGDRDSSVELDTPFGRLGFDVHTETRKAEKTADGLSVALKYALIDAGGDRSERDVSLTARFLV